MPQLVSASKGVATRLTVWNGWIETVAGVAETVGMAVPQLVVEVSQFLLRGQIALEQQPACLLETALASQNLRRDTSIFQPRPLTVDEADGRLRDGHIRQTWTKLLLTHEWFPSTRVEVS